MRYLSFPVTNGILCSAGIFPVFDFRRNIILCLLNLQFQKVFYAIPEFPVYEVSVECLGSEFFKTVSESV